MRRGGSVHKHHTDICAEWFVQDCRRDAGCMDSRRYSSRQHLQRRRHSSFRALVDNNGGNSRPGWKISRPLDLSGHLVHRPSRLKPWRWSQTDLSLLLYFYHGARSMLQDYGFVSQSLSRLHKQTHRQLHTMPSWGVLVLSVLAIYTTRTRTR